MRGASPTAAHGFTMLELMIAVAILAITVTLAVPSMRSVIQNSRSSAAANEFVSVLNYARSEAVKRRNTVRICTSANGSSCRASTDTDVNNWHKGWIVLDPSGNVLRRADAMVSSVQISAGAGEVYFAGTGGVVTATPPSFAITVSGCQGNNQRDLALSATGRVVITRSACP